MRAAGSAGLAFEVARTDRPSSAEESASLQGIALGQLLRTIVIRRAADDYVFVLVPGGRQIDWPKLRAYLGVKRLSLPDADEARAATGYERGTITPFGASHAWPVIADAAARDVDTVAIGAGAHGVNLHVDTSALIAALHAEVVDVTRPDAPNLGREAAARQEPSLSRCAVELAVLHQNISRNASVTCAFVSPAFREPGCRELALLQHERVVHWRQCAEETTPRSPVSGDGRAPHRGSRGHPGTGPGSVR